MKINWKKLLMLGLQCVGILVGLILNYVGLADASFYTLFFTLFFNIAFTLAFIDEVK